ncbi:hypothetical protein NQZ68_024707 [Dissostichus eleginoides]|nr:hypothetical protein NQZ68_024707 [Dissostichus eleginoides]
MAVIFGPTLMRAQEETVAAMLDIKFQNIVVEILIENCKKIFSYVPEDSTAPPVPPPRITPRKRQPITISKRPPHGQNDSPIAAVEVSTNPVPLQRTRPLGCAPQLPRDPPPRLALMPRPGSRQDKHSEPDAGRIDDTRQRPDSSAAANGESGVYVSRVPSFQGRKLPPKGTPANREDFDGLIRTRSAGGPICRPPVRPPEPPSRFPASLKIPSAASSEAPSYVASKTKFFENASRHGARIKVDETWTTSCDLCMCCWVLIQLEGVTASTLRKWLLRN